MATVKTIAEQLDKGDTVTIPTACLGVLIAQVQMHLQSCDWLVQVRGDVTHINKRTPERNERATTNDE